MSGCIVATVDGVEHRVQAGDEVVIKPGQVHTFSNGSATEPLVFRCTAEPALNLQWLLTEMAESAIRGGGRWDDASVLAAGYTPYQIRGEYRLAGMPSMVQTLIVSVLAGVALLLGRTKRIRPRPAAAKSGYTPRRDSV